jgi:4-hydroxy-3-methylbut-2-enyl diphosphate reductase
VQIEKAKEMGFCSGVKRTLKLLQEAASKYGEIETLGAVVHNPQVVDSLAQLSVRVVGNVEQLKGGTVAIPSHGAAPKTIEKLQNQGLRIIDTTCPIVRKAQTAARNLAEAGFGVIIFGDADHPEVKGILGWAGERGIVARDVDTVLRSSKLPRHLGILCQTTQSPSNFIRFVNELSASLLLRVDEIRIVNTICQAIKKRQAAALKLAEETEIMIVVGGRDSANTRHLVEICSAAGVEAYHVETAAEIDKEWLKGHCRVGITAGASTPDQVIHTEIRGDKRKGLLLKLGNRIKLS